MNITVRVALAIGLSVVVGFLALWVFGVHSGVDTNPPTCWNRSGGEVSCDRPNGLIFFVTSAACAFVLLAVFIRRRTR